MTVMSNHHVVLASLPPCVNGVDFGILKFELCNLEIFQNCDHFGNDDICHESKSRQESSSGYNERKEVVNSSLYSTDSKPFICRLQFWGQSAHVDLSRDINQESTKASRVVGEANDTTLYRSVAEYRLSGSILCLKHYFKDMSTLPLIIIEKLQPTTSVVDNESVQSEMKTNDNEGSTHIENVIGIGRLNLVLMLNDLMNH